MRACRQLTLAALTLLASATPAAALDPRAPASSYLRTTFTTEDGLATNIVNAVVQSKNGFLWIGTYSGLTRFDGRHFSNTEAGVLPGVRSLAEGPDGDLWLGTEAGVKRFPQRSFDRPAGPQVTVYHLGAGADDSVSRVRFMRDGTLWAGARQGLYRWNGAGFTRVVSGINVTRIEEGRDGHILLSCSQGFLEWDGAQVIKHPDIPRELGVAPKDLFQVFQDRQASMWYSTARGLFHRVGGSVSHIGMPGNSYETYEDQDGNTWISREGGVFRVRAGALEPVATGAQCRVLYSDRDGSLWIGTNGAGLIYVRNRAIRTFTTDDGLGGDVIMAVLAGRSGKLWVASNCGGVAWLDGDRFHPLPDPNRLVDCAYSLAEDNNNNLFVGTYGNGLIRVHGGQFTQYSKAQGLPNAPVSSLLFARDDSLWIGTRAGLTRMVDGHLRTYTTADGLSDIRIQSLSEASDGTIWVMTAAGLDRRIGDRFSTIRSFPAAYLAGDYRGHMYIGFAPNLYRTDGEKFSEPVPGFEAFGMAAFSNELWFGSPNGILRTTEGSLDRWDKQRGPLDYTKFARADGMQSAECSSIGGPHLASTPDGRLWVATEQGLAMIDVPHLPRAPGRPTLYVRDVVLGRKPQQPGDGLVLPPGTSHVELYFDPVELFAPHRIRLQYKLDGVDEDWLDAPPSHVATYSGMRPGPHIFHVRSTNRDGVWDLAGTTYQIIQVPFFYQTVWFEALSGAAFVCLLFGIYRYRLSQLAHEYNVRLEERVTERTRIARDLHDTLLQSFQGLMLRFQVVNDMLPDGKVRNSLELALQRADKAIAEARTAVYDLRSSTFTTNDLTVALKAIGEELGTPEGAAFRLEVVGGHRELHPIIRDETYRIAREALRNAFGHAEASRIEVELTYGERSMRLRIRDDGKGMSSEVFQEGRRGHYGLCGMRERATQIGGKLEIWSTPGAGTEIELTIAAAIAYQKSASPSFFEFFRGFPQ